MWKRLGELLGTFSVDRKDNMARIRAPRQPAALLTGLTGLAISFFMAFGAAPQIVHAQEAPVQLSIAAQPLGDALIQVANFFSLDLAYSPGIVKGLSSPAVSGSLTADEALRRLLAGTGIEFRRNGRNVSLSRPASDGMTQLAPVVVTGTFDPTTEGTTSYTSTGPSTAATGLELTMRETPQSVSVITRQQMDDFNLTTLQDVTKATPGLYLKSDGVSDQETRAYSRGFAFQHINVDGLPLSVSDFNARGVSADMVMYDRVEVVRGATGLLQGAGTPSGSMNLVRKRPTNDPLLNISATFGSWDQKQTTIDASHALNESKTLRGRVAASWRDADSFVDVTNTKNGTLYGVFEADLSPSTKLGFGGYIQRTRTDGVFLGLPTYSDGRHMELSRSTFLGAEDTFQDRDNDVLFADIEHLFENGWSVKAAFTHLEASSDSRFASNSRVAGSETTFSQAEYGWRYGTKQNVLDVRASGPLTLFGREHELLIGASYREDDVAYAETWGSGGFSTGRVFEISDFDPGYSLRGGPPANPLRQENSTREKGIYMAGKFRLTDPLSFIAGARLGWYTQDGTGGWYTGAARDKTRSMAASAELVPYAGLVYDIDDQHSVYASVTEVFQPQSSIDAQGRTLDPLQGINYEVGVKGEYFNGALNASAAVFRVKQKNRAIRDEINCPVGGIVTCYRAAGEVKSEGIELQLAGELTPGWQIAAGYTYASAKYTKDALASNVGQRVNSDEPRHIFKLFTSYKLRGDYSRWSVNGYMQAQSEIYKKSENYYASQGSYTIFGVGATYRMNSQLRFQLNIDNLFDRRYYTGVSSASSATGTYYGSPRSVLFSMNYSY